MSDLFVPEARVLTSRRDFFKRAGGGLAALGLLATAATAAGCDSDDTDDNADYTLDFSTDIGVLNYAYALEQLEAAFYTQVVATPFSGMSADEMEVLTDLRDHEVVHREFFKAVLGTNAIPALTPDFSGITFTNRTQVLTTARVFEDLGVAAYNGAGKYLRSAANLTVAGKIVSVEARHAAAIRDLIDNRSPYTVGAGSDAVVTGGLDRALTPSQVLSQAQDYITETLGVRNT
jgi:Ferritin-like domain